jgi:lipopolysaccharide export system permease protein
MMTLFSLLSRYIAQVFLFWLTVCLLGFATVISLFNSMEILRKSLRKPEISLGTIVEMILLKMPGQLQALLPFIVLLAAIITFIKFAHSNELIIIRSIGISIWRVLRTMVGIILVFGALNVALLQPFCALLTDRFLHLTSLHLDSRQNLLTITDTGLWLREVTDQEQRIVRLEKANLEKGLFTNVTFYIFSPQGVYLEKKEATEAQLQAGQWVLKDAFSTSPQDPRGSPSAPYLSTSLTLGFVQESFRNPQSLSFWKLPKYMKASEKSGLSSLPYRLYWYAQIAKIAFMAVMVLLAATFSLRTNRQRHTVLVVSMGIGAGFLLHFASDIIYALGLAQRIPLVLAAWGPSLLAFSLSSSILLHLEDG